MSLAPQAVRDLKVWQKSIDLVVACYRLSIRTHFANPKSMHVGSSEYCRGVWAVECPGIRSVSGHCERLAS
jgi:hypothetical protein